MRRVCQREGARVAFLVGVRRTGQSEIRELAGFEFEIAGLLEIIYGCRVAYWFSGFQDYFARRHSRYLIEIRIWMRARENWGIARALCFDSQC